MATTFKNSFLIAIITMAITFLNACSNEYRFHGQTDDQTKMADPVTPDQPNKSQENPPVTTTPTPASPAVEKLQYSNGSCSQGGTQLLSCLNCKTQTKLLEPDYSLKATQLIKFMKTACKVKNGSDPKDKSMPSDSVIQKTLFKFLNQATKSSYPDTLANSTEAKLLNELSNVNSSYYKKLFGSLWYQPPYSDAFETYFGMATQEAKALFCYENESPSFSFKGFTPLVSKSYSDCQSFDFLGFNCKETADYIQGNQTRTALHKAIKKSMEEPFEDGRYVATNKCHWEKIQGVFNSEMEDVIVSWVNQGFQVSINHEKTQQALCEPLKELTQDLSGKITAAAYICEDL